MAESEVSTDKKCTTVSKPYRTIHELFSGVDKDAFEYLGDRYLRFLELYDKMVPRWRYKLWGYNQRPCDLTFMSMDSYPSIGKAIGTAIRFHMAQEDILKAQEKMGMFMQEQEQVNEQIGKLGKTSGVQ